MQTYTNILGGSLRASGSVPSLVNMEIYATYWHTWASAHTFSQAITTIKPGYMVQISSAHRVYGDCTITLGNTTARINDVYFNSRNPNMPAAYVVTEQTIPATQLDVPVSAALFISPNTVDADLARVERQLGIRSRATIGHLMATFWPHDGELKNSPHAPGKTPATVALRSSHSAK